MNVLILGSGGREHAFAWKISQSNLLSHLFIAPGNPGTANVGTNLALDVTDFEGIVAAIRENHIDLVIVGPEEPLVRGIRNFIESQADLQHVGIVGPGSDGAQLEGSKDFSKNFMHTYGIPTAASKTFTKETIQDGLLYLEEQSLPIVLKADGLAAGKGVIIAQSLKEAKDALEEMLLESKFGAASEKVVIEQFLRGIELSVFVLTDGKDYVLLPDAKDYKRIGEGDSGPNTGGMGAVSPVPFADAAFMDKVHNQVIVPTVKGLRSEGIPYKGFIFFGLINVKGDPYVIEYNCRLGDPETEVILPRLQTDLVSLLAAADNGTLQDVNIEYHEGAFATVMAVSGGYPGDYQKGFPITGIELVTKEAKTTLFQAGTGFKEDAIVTNGGRVLTVTAQGNTISEAVETAKNALGLIQFEGMNFRNDIGFEFKG